uniref:Butyrophilin subfamily 1 member A1 n=1 Tax=Pelusios castaneus TaxID=367368 RepID=A0A8C8SBH9_9SAUR
MGLWCSLLIQAQFAVVGPEHPIPASLRGEAILSCHLFPRMSAENMEVRWIRSQLSTVVHLYKNGKDQDGEQGLEYRGRTELLKDDIANGRVSLRIRDIRPSDDGQYTCVFQSGVSYEEALLELQVAGLGSDPALSMEDGRSGSEIRVVCRSSGWYPKPDVEWRNLQGQLLPSDSKTISEDANGLFQTKTSIFITKGFWLHFSPHLFLYALPIRGPTKSRDLLANLLLAYAKVAIYKTRERRLAEGGSCDCGAYFRSLVRARIRAEFLWAASTVDVTLDPETAHPELVLSEDRKRVRHGNKRQDLPNTPARFDNCVCVLGAERFSGGRRYWEVEVGDKTEWAVGVCRESARRKGEVTPSSGNGYWVVWLRDGKYEACTSPPTPLPVSVRPSQVGIFLDYKAGEVSFYNVVDRSPLFTFTVTFSGTLRPYFSPGLSAGGTNAAPLIICPVPAQAGGNL